MPHLDTKLHTDFCCSTFQTLSVRQVRLRPENVLGLLHTITSTKNKSAESHFSGKLSWILLNKFLIGWSSINCRCLPGASAAQWRHPYDSRGRCAESGPRRSQSFILIITSRVTLKWLNKTPQLPGNSFLSSKELLFNNSSLGKARSFIFIA